MYRSVEACIAFILFFFMLSCLRYGPAAMGQKGHPGPHWQGQIAAQPDAAAPAALVAAPAGAGQVWPAGPDCPGARWRTPCRGRPRRDSWPPPPCRIAGRSSC
jgi:hypothetical protein